MSKSTKKQNVSIALILIVLAAILRIYGVWWGLPQVYEEATPLIKAWDMWGWGPQKNLDLNPHFFNYPSLTIYTQFLGQGLLYLGMKLFRLVDSTMDYQVLYFMQKTPYYTLGRVITALFGIASVWVLYLLGRRIGGLGMAIPAAFLLCINTFHISKSQMIEVDVPLTFFTLLTLYFIVCALENPTMRNYIYMGLALGLASSTKYTAALLLLPLFAAHIIVRQRTVPQRKKSSSGKQKPPWKFLGLALAVAVLTFFITSPYTLIDASTFFEHLSYERQHMRIGHFGLDASLTWIFYAQSLGGRMLGWPSALLALFGMIYLACIRRRPWAGVLALFLVPFLIAVSTWSMKADRYILPILPIALLFVGGMIAEGLHLPKIAKAPLPWRLVAVSLATLLLGVHSVSAFPHHLSRLKPDTRTLAKEWVEAHVPSGSFIAMESYGPELFGPHILSTLDEEVKKRVLTLTADTPHYAVQRIPMFQMKPERSEVFYDISLYEIADIVITSSAVRSRYMNEEIRFRHQVAFYDTLEARYQKVIEFVPHGNTGPMLIVYRNRQHDVPFGGRRIVQGPPSLRHTSQKLTGSEELFYIDLGLNYEVFKYYKEALASYELAFQYPIIRPGVYNSLVLRTTRCLLALDRVNEAAEFLQTAAAQAPSPAARNRFLSLRQQILSRMRSKTR